MPDERVEALIALGLDDATAQKALKQIDAMQAGMKGVQKQADEAKKKLREMAEQGAKLREVGTVMAGLGAAIIGPLTLVANEYAQRYKNLEKSANDFNAALDRQRNATSALGRVAATALTPVMNEVAAVMEKIARFAEQHPDLIKAAVMGGAGLVAGGGALAMAGTAISSIAKGVEVLKTVGGSGIGGAFAQAATAVGALAVGAKLGETAVKELGKATGDQRLAQFQLTDALKTAREIVGAAILGLAKAFVDAKVTIGRIADILNAIFTKVRLDIEDAIDRLATGIRKFILGIQGFVTDLINKLADMFPQLGIKKSEQKYSTAELQQGEDEALAERSFRRGVQLNQLGDQLAKNEADRQKQYQVDQQNLKNFADSIINFTKTGSLGTTIDGIAKGIGDAIGKFLGGGSGGAQKAAGASFSPEAIRAWIDRNKALTESDRNYREELKTAQLQFQEANQKARRDYQDSVSKIDTDFMRNELKAADEFRRTEAKEQANANKERLRTIEDMNDRLKDAASARDVAGFIQAQREGEKQLRHQQEDASQAAKERLADYLQQRKDARQEREYQLADLKKAFDKESREREIAYREQLSQLQNKHILEKQAIDRQFAQQLADLSDNIAGLHSMQTAYYAQSSIDLANWVQKNQATLRGLYGQTTGTPSSTAYTGYTSSQLNAIAATLTQPTSAANMAGLQRIGSSLRLPSFASGIDRLPSDMFALVHRGERITPAWQNNGGSGSPITVNVVNPIGADNIVGAATEGALRGVARARQLSLNMGRGAL